jgi:hydrogenase maturation protease
VSGRVLIAGIGNIFLGDDGFGVEIARRMSERKLSPEVCVKDFGIRGFDLACALTEPWDLIIMADASARGGEPGSIYVMEIDPNSQQEQARMLNAHGLHPASAMQLARTLGTITARLVLVACEPADLGGEEGRMGLSSAVENAVESAICTIERIAGEFTQSANLKQGVHA